jgi:rod shape-determining protein MreC
MRFIYTKSFKRAFAAFVLVACLIMADQLNYLSLVKSGTHKFFGVTSQNVGNVFNGIKNLFKVAGTLSSLAAQNAELEQQINELSFENARLQSAKAENLALRRALNFQEDPTYNTLPAEVRIMDPTGFSQTVIIDKGEVHGAVIGQAVAAAPGLLVGRITKTYRTTSEVSLITDPATTISAEVTESGARGLVRGEHGISLVLDLVTQNEVIKSGDKLITSGLSGDFPRGLLVGEINSIKSSSSELFQQAFVSPAADLKNLNTVFIVQ